MKGKYFLLGLILIYLASMGGCGNGPGTPGSSGTEDTGVMLDVLVLPHDGATNKDTSNVDSAREICPSGQPEPFTDHQATVTITARLINQNAAFQPGNLFVEKYTISYRASSDSIGTPPIVTDTRFQTIPIIAPTATQTGTTTGTPTASPTTTTTQSIIFLDVPRKDKYTTDMLSGAFSSSMNNFSIINNYTAVIKFEGHDQFGNPFSFVGQAEFSIGDYDNCQ